MDALTPHPDALLRALADPALEPAFRRPTRLGVDSAWYGHVPFAHWLVGAAAPRLLVELGTHNGVSYAAFCEAVRVAALDTRCLAVDSWDGDEHAGFYGADVFSDLDAFNRDRYASFSRLLRARFDEALPLVADGSVDLLHIDGRHRYEDVRNDFETWVPKLSPRAVVLFHDTNVRERGFGVHRLWAELAPTRPSFEFLHAHGLGVLAHGGAAPDAVLALCAPDAPVSVLRERFGLLGERWAMDQALRDAQGATAAIAAAERDVRAWATGMQARLVELEAQAARMAEVEAQRRSLRQQLAHAKVAAARLELRVAAAPGETAVAVAVAERHGRDAMAQAVARERDAHAASMAELERARAGIATLLLEVGRLREDRRLILGSTAWRVTRPLRWAMARLRGGAAGAVPEDTQPADLAPMAAAAALPALAVDAVPHLAAPGDSDLPASAADVATLPTQPALAPPAPAATQDIPRQRILFVSGEPHTPGSTYRTARYAAAARALGWDAEARPFAGTDDAALAGAGVVVLWRCPWEGHTEGIVRVARANGAHVVFDVDDLMVRPELATVDVIDGIRSQRFSEEGTREFFGRIRRTMDEADLVSVTTDELAAQVRELQAEAHVLPNGWDGASLAAARAAVRLRAQAGEAIGDTGAVTGEGGRLRIGYAGGSRTHQRDFALCVGGVAALLRARPEALLVLFRDPRGGEGVVLTNEFPELAGLAERIEWRDMVALEALPGELARLDVNLAPLELGNPFCEAKSELKYWEAALAGVPTIASPTGPYARAITHGETGLLAADAPAWEAGLAQLAGDPALRARLARAAYHDSLWRFSPHRQAEALAGVLGRLEGGRAGARAFELALRRAAHPVPARSPQLPPHEVLFAHDTLRDAAVSVVIPLYNYADYVLEALDSVHAQTLERLDLIVVDDGSTDDGVQAVLDWAATNAGRFTRLLVLRHRANAGLGPARNTGFAAAETPFVLPLDADNRLRPDAAAALLACLDDGRGTAFAYPAIQSFDGDDSVFGRHPFSAARLVGGNYVDAMALVAKWAWAAAGGYDHVRFGWEDYDFWCRLVELGLWGTAHPEVLAEYRVHKASMIHTTTEIRGNKRLLVEDLEQRHGWLAVAGKRML